MSGVNIFYQCDLIGCLVISAIRNYSQSVKYLNLSVDSIGHHLGNRHPQNDKYAWNSLVHQSSCLIHDPSFISYIFVLRNYTFVLRNNFVLRNFTFLLRNNFSYNTEILLSILRNDCYVIENETFLYRSWVRNKILNIWFRSHVMNMFKVGRTGNKFWSRFWIIHLTFQTRTWLFLITTAIHKFFLSKLHQISSFSVLT